MAETQKVVHPFAPIVDAHSRVLILGSFPSVISRQQSFFTMPIRITASGRCCLRCLKKSLVSAQSSATGIISPYGM